VDLKTEVLKTISGFLCTECKMPLYLSLDDKREEICVNPGCVIRDRTIVFYDMTRANQLAREMRDIEKAIRGKISNCERG
jgi:hypothetical protein